MLKVYEVRLISHLLTKKKLSGLISFLAKCKSWRPENQKKPTQTKMKISTRTHQTFNLSAKDSLTISFSSWPTPRISVKGSDQELTIEIPREELAAAILKSTDLSKYDKSDSNKLYLKNLAESCEKVLKNWRDEELEKELVNHPISKVES